MIRMVDRVACTGMVENLGPRAFRLRIFDLRRPKNSNLPPRLSRTTEQISTAAPTDSPHHPVSMLLVFLSLLLLPTSHALDVRTQRRQQIYAEPTDDLISPLGSITTNSTNATNTNTTGMEGDSAVSDGDGDGSSPMADQLKQGGPAAKSALLNADLPVAKSCTSNCFGNGFCINGECSCKQGFRGKNCETGGSCSLSGACGSKAGTGTCDLNTMRCKCKAGYAGLECDATTCLNDCSSKGYCLQDDKGHHNCFCKDGWTGADCSLPTCPNSCSDKGTCVDMKCQCDEGYVGEDCGQRFCPKECSGHGVCNDGECACMPRWSGLACDVGECPTNDPTLVCSGHGDCEDGECQCDDRFVGPDCAADACPMGCIYGTCTDEGKCLCDHGFRGKLVQQWF
jgi:hypothetical protein